MRWWCQISSHPIPNYREESEEQNQNLPTDGDTVSPETPVLHRLMLSTVGRPMWKYKTDHDLLIDFRGAIQAHQSLCAIGIRHRDISAVNIILTEKVNGGFITDLELAHIQSSTMQKREGTAQFVSTSCATTVLHTKRTTTSNPLSYTTALCEIS